MNFKVLVTGKNRRIAKDVCEHLEKDRGYEIIKCNPSMDALFDLVPVEMPNVVIICLGDETYETVKVYDVLKDCVRGQWLQVLVIASDDDRRVFMNNTKLQKMLFMPRPLSLMALYTKLIEIEHEAEAKAVKAKSIFTEFVNEEEIEKERRKRVLIVDDDAGQLMQMKEHLSEFYDATAVRSGSAALKFLEKHQVDIILLDYIMPEMDGPTALMKIRERKECVSTPVIFLTGVSERETVLKTLLELKPQGYVVKPVKKSEIVAKIIDVLG